MKNIKYTFKRYEQKYLLVPEKYLSLRRSLDGLIEPDEYFESTVCSIYYDTEDYRLIRRSIDSSVYKQKLRLRSYNVPSPEDTVFVELKQKYSGLVYKRRIAMPVSRAESYALGMCPSGEESQAAREIDWFLRTNRLEPRVFLASDREAYVASQDREVRLTFDRNIRWRDSELSLCSGSHGEVITKPGQVLLELKLPAGCPLWLTRILSENGLYPTSFAKYGNCYRTKIINGAEIYV